MISLFLRAMYSIENPVLVSKDFDFLRLLGVTPRIIGSDEFIPYNNFFRERIKENPYKLYIKFPEKEKFKEILFDFKFEKYFHIDGVSEEKNNKLKEIMTGFWKDFSN